MDKLPLLEEYILNLVNDNYSDKTVLNYKRDLAILDSFLDYTGIAFNDLNKINISKYKEYLRTGKYLEIIRKKRFKGQNVDPARSLGKSSPKASRRLSMYSGRLGGNSVNRMLSALRSYLKFLNDADYKPIPISPDSVKMLKTEKKESQVAELEELVKLIESPEIFETKKLVIFRNRAIMELLFSTGMRISELINLNRDELKLEHNSVKDSRIYILGKGKKQRFVYLTPRCKLYLNRYLETRSDNYPALFIPYRGLRVSTHDPYIVRLSTNYVQSKIKEYRKLSGIIVPTSAHSLRHGFATYLAENGASPVAIQRLLGHESLQTTSKYVHSSDKFAEEMHKKFHPLSAD